MLGTHNVYEIIAVWWVIIALSYLTDRQSSDWLSGKLNLYCHLNATIHIRALCFIQERPTAQIAHLVFADTKANAEKPKELFFANAQQKLRKPAIE